MKLKIFLLLLGVLMTKGAMAVEAEKEKIAKVPVGAIFQHYKNKKNYKILAVGRHTEDMGLYVVYQGLYDCEEFGPNPIWIRPLGMFLETVEYEGKETPRFIYVVESN
jgi:hypothetical protein